MSRRLIGAVFALLTVSTIVTTVEAAADAFGDPSAHRWLVTGFWLLKVAVVGAFGYFLMSRPPSRRPARRPIAFVACAGAIVGAMALGGPASGSSTPLLVAGEALALASCAWLLVSVLALGRCFGILPEARGLVTRGPYRLVRHPVYLGELGACGGLLLGAPTQRNLVAAVVVLAVQIVRMRLEEQALTREFPEYAGYAARTPRVLPVRTIVRGRPAVVGSALVLAVVLTVGAVALPASPAAAAASKPKKKAAKPKKKAAKPPAAPRLTSPANAQRAEALPTFHWAAVRNAVRYEFQLAADPRFASIVGGQGKGSFQTPNTFATATKTVADGTYYWRVRAIDASDRIGRWSAVRSLLKAWTQAASLIGPADGAAVLYPSTPLVLRWSSVKYAYKYVVRIATDPELAHSALGSQQQSVETSGTSYALPGTLAPGRYFWGVTPLDSSKHPGRPSAVAAFEWSWPTATATRNSDLRDDPRLPDPVGAARFYDPQLSWDAIPGAAQYQVEINASSDFAPGSRVCCDETVLGTSLSPRTALPNNTYYWRVRALDLDGNAGQWNEGPGGTAQPSFRKDFAATTASVPNLRMWDAGINPDDTSDVPVMEDPVVRWDSVPGASSYEVKVVPTACMYDIYGNCLTRPASNPCEWSAPSGLTWDVTTATPAWTPLSSSSRGSNPTGTGSRVAVDLGHALVPSWGYCVEVRPIDRNGTSGDARGDWTQLGGNGATAFEAASPPTCDTAPDSTLTDADYDPVDDGRAHQQTFTETLPSGRRVTGTYNRRMPVFSWIPVPGACGYFVVVARDPDFTDIVDLALTPQTAYAPRGSSGSMTYPDETTTYYWAVLPSQFADGRGVTSRLQDNAPQVFRKQSLAPQPLAPGEGADVAAQPSFHWSLPRDEEGRPEEVRAYRLQVDDDPTFGSPIDDVVTDSTAFTSASTYPADTQLYWRVRATDDTASGGKAGLTWSPTRTFTRRLPAPVLQPDNPLDGPGIPVFAWSPVTGAVSYDMHVEQADGTKRDFTMRSTAFTPVTFYGTGVWRWQVRANFKSATRTVSSGYTPMAPFARRINPAAGLRTTRSGSGVVLSWDPVTMARQYRVQISTSDSFSAVIEDAMTENPSYAPRMGNPAWTSGKSLYWRIAAMDEGSNLGAWASTRLRQAAAMRVRARGPIGVGRIATVTVTVTDAKRRPIAGALVRIGGTGSGTAKRTSRKGTVRLRVRGLRAGTVTLRAEKRGYIPTAAKLRAR
jgi:protein-S-isoprenylcysteine O-methyltransferase Ste14